MTASEPPIQASRLPLSLSLHVLLARHVAPGPAKAVARLEPGSVRGRVDEDRNLGLDGPRRASGAGPPPHWARSLPSPALEGGPERVEAQGLGIFRLRGLTQGLHGAYAAVLWGCGVSDLTQCLQVCGLRV